MVCFPEKNLENGFGKSERRGERRRCQRGRFWGGTATLISDLEKGRRTTTLEKLTELAQYYNISTDYLLGLTDEPRPLR